MVIGLSLLLFFICAANILESFDNHPPLILPSSTFHLELGKPIVEPALFEQLARLQDFISQLPRSETRAEPEAEEQVTSSLHRHNETAVNETLWCFRVFCWLILLCPNSACQWDDYRQPVCDLGLGQSRPGSRRTGGLRPGRPRLSYICGTSSGPSPSRWPEQLWGRPGPEAEEPGAAEHPPRTGRHGLPQEPGAGPILPAHATQHPTGDGAGWAGGWPAGGHPPTKER